MSVIRPFSVLSKDEIGPESKTGRSLSKAEILGVGVFSPLSISGHAYVQFNRGTILVPAQKGVWTKTLRGQRRNGLSKNTLLDDRFSARRLLRSFGAPPKTVLAVLVPISVSGKKRSR